MPCYKPLTAWYSRFVNASGKRSLVFTPSQAEQPDDSIEVACGQCIGCRLERSRQWAIRCMHEASLYSQNCFITLTFNPESLASRDNPLSVDVRDFQLFMKRLRKRFKGVDAVDVNGKVTFPIRFFHCGEYGELSSRPHYHACLFNFDFPDKVLWKLNNGFPLFTSESLSELWPFGYSSIGGVTFESAAYVARYVMKKSFGDHVHQIGDDGLKPYDRLDSNSGLITQVNPEYITMSRRPGIASGWFDKYKDEVYPNDFVVVNGKKVPVPRYYDKQLERINPFEYDDVKAERLLNGVKYRDNNTPERLAVREEVQKRKLDKLIRPLDGEIYAS